MINLYFQCPWPVGSEELVFVDRPAFGPKFGEAANQLGLEYFKEEQFDPVFELSAFNTPPQTPGTEIFGKNTANAVPVKVINPIIKVDNVNVSNKFFTDSDVSSNLSSENGPNKSTKPKLKSISQPVNYNVKRVPSKGYVLKKFRDNSVGSNKQNKSVNNHTNCSLASSIDNSSFVHKWVNDSAIINGVTEKPKENMKVFSKKRLKKKIFEEFDFDKIKKESSTKLDNVTVENKKPSYIKACDSMVKKCKIISIKKEKISSSIKEFDFHNIGSNKVLNPVYENNSSHIIKPENQCGSEVLDFNLDEFVNQHCNNNLVEFEKSNQIVVNNSVDSETLALSTSSFKDSGVDQDSHELDMSLDDFLSDLDYFSPESQLLKNENFELQNSSNENSVADDKFIRKLSSSEDDFIQSLYS